MKLADVSQGTSPTPIYSSSSMSRFKVPCGASSQRVGCIWVRGSILFRGIGADIPLRDVSVSDALSFYIFLSLR